MKEDEDEEGYVHRWPRSLCTSLADLFVVLFAYVAILPSHLPTPLASRTFIPRIAKNRAVGDEPNRLPSSWELSDRILFPILTENAWKFRLFPSHPTLMKSIRWIRFVASGFDSFDCIEIESFVDRVEF